VSVQPVHATEPIALARIERAAAARRRTAPWLALYAPLPFRRELALGVLAWIAFVALWYGIVGGGYAQAQLLPYPHQVTSALVELVWERGFLADVLVSIRRIFVSFAIAAAVAVPLGVLMGAFYGVEAAVNPLVSPARYLPAPSFAPLLLMWLGTGDSQKVALLVIGVIWFLITLVADHVRTLRRELLETALTLGADRRRALFRVVLPESLPGIVVALRQMLAVSWTYLVIAEIIAATDGIGAMMMRAKRFVHTDEIMAGIVTIGLLGIAFDLLFRLLHRWSFPYLYLDEA
jgi:NitT/TauT family transport system permease protein